MAIFKYNYHEERGEFSAWVDDANDNTVWQVRYPDFYEDDSSGELIESSTIFEDGYMKNADDIDGLQDYLVTMGLMDSSDELVSADSYAKGGGIESKMKDKLSKNFELPIEMAVYVPSTEKANQVISKRDFHNRIEEVQKYLSNLVGGFSATNIEGGYMSEEKGLVQEDVVKVTAFSGRDNFEQKLKQLVEKISDWAKDWSQESIGFEFEGDLFYIEGGASFARGGSIDYETYHDTLSSALDEVEKYVKAKGFEFVDESYSPDITNGGVSYGQTARATREIHKEGRKKNDVVIINIYRMDSGRYELTAYTSYENGGQSDEKVFQKVKVTIKDIDMGGDVIYKQDHWFNKDQIANKSNKEIGEYILKKTGMDYGNAYSYSVVRTKEERTKSTLLQGKARKFESGGVYSDKRDGAVYSVDKNASGKWTVFSESPKWEKRDEFENGLASKEDAIMLAKIMSGNKKEREPRYDNGGNIKSKNMGIPNNYKGMTSENIWNEFTDQQRVHFLVDHFEDIGILAKDIPSISEKNWNGISDDVKMIFKQHTMMGQYREGGETDDNILEFTIPNWALSSLINGDDSGNEDEDIEKINAFTERIENKYGNAMFMLPDEEDMDLGFRYKNDIDNLGSDCSLLLLNPTKKYVGGGEADTEEEDNEDQSRLEELMEENDLPEEVIREYAEWAGVEIKDITDLPFNGRYDSEEDFAMDLVEQGAAGDIENYLEMYPTDMRIFAQEEADSRVDNMDDDDLIREADLEDEIGDIEGIVSKIEDLESEIEDCEERIRDLRDEINEDATEGEAEDFENQISEIEIEKDEKESEKSSLEDEKDNLSDRDDIIEKAKDELRDRYYEDILDELEKDAVGYFVDNLGYEKENLENNGFYIDYKQLASDLSSDYNFIEHGGDVYVFSSYRDGGMTYAKGGGLKSKRYAVYLSNEITGHNYDSPNFKTNDYDKAIEYAKEMSLKSHPKKPRGYEYTDYDYVSEVYDVFKREIIADFAHGEYNYVENPKRPLNSKYLVKKSTTLADLLKEKEYGIFYSAETGATNNLIDIVESKNRNADIDEVKKLVEMFTTLNDIEHNLDTYKKWAKDKISPTAKAGRMALSLFNSSYVEGVEYMGKDYARGGNVGSIEKSVAEVNEMIKLANEKDIEVTDTSGTWQSPMKYKPLKYSNGVLYIEYEELDLYRHNKGMGSNWESKKQKITKHSTDYGHNINGSDAGYAQREELKQIAKMYRKAIKNFNNYADGGVMEKGGLTGDVHSITDKILSQKIQIFLDKVKPFKFYYIDEKTLYVGFGENFTTDQADKFYKEASSSKEFFDADSVNMKFNPETNDTMFSIDLKKEVKYAKGGWIVDEGVTSENKKYYFLLNKKNGDKRGLFNTKEEANKELKMESWKMFDYTKKRDGGVMAKGGGIDNWIGSYKKPIKTSDVPDFLNSTKNDGHKYSLWNKSVGVTYAYNGKLYANNGQVLPKGTVIDLDKVMNFWKNNNNDTLFVEDEKLVILPKKQDKYNCYTTGYDGMKNSYGNEDDVTLQEAVEFCWHYDDVRKKYATKEDLEKEIKSTPYGKNNIIASTGNITGVVVYKLSTQQYADGGVMAKGGMSKTKKTTFKQKSAAIAKSLLEKKKVPKRLRKDYGKTYNKKEATIAANRITGAMRAKELLKKK